MRGLLKKLMPTGIARKMFWPFFLFGLFLVMAASLGITLIIRYYLFGSLESQLENQTVQIANVFEKRIQALNTSVITAGNQASIKALINGSFSGYQEFSVFRSAYNHVTLTNTLNGYENMYLFIPERSYVMGSASGNVSSQFDIASAPTTRGWYEDIQKQYQSIVQRSDFVPPVTGGEECFASVYCLHYSTNWNIRGVIVATMDKRFLDALIKNTLFEDESCLLVLNPDGTVAYASGTTPGWVEERLDAGAAPEEAFKDTHFLFSQGAGGNGFRFLAMMEKRAFTRSILHISALVMLIMTAVFVVILIASHILSVRIAQPIRQITRFIHGIEASDLEARLDIHTQDEIEELANSFNALLDSVRENQVLRRQAQLNALQKQIDPHFIFNTLETVKALAILKDTQGVYKTLQALGDMLRYTTNRDEKSTTAVKTELEHVQNYLYIQKIRFKERLAYEIDAEERLLKCLTLKFVMQPLVENAIRYAMEPSEGSFRMWIRVFEEPEGVLCIEVADNGPGIEEDTLKRLMDFIQDKGEQGTFGIGLKNIHQRIQLFFSPEYGLKVESRPGLGTAVRITMPKRSA